MTSSLTYPNAKIQTATANTSKPLINTSLLLLFWFCGCKDDFGIIVDKIWYAEDALMWFCGCVDNFGIDWNLDEDIFTWLCGCEDDLSIKLDCILEDVSM